jgi:hypothetical protein
MPLSVHPRQAIAYLAQALPRNSAQHKQGLEIHRGAVLIVAPRSLHGLRRGGRVSGKVFAV